MITPGKKTKKQTVLWQKNTKFHIFVDKKINNMALDFTVPTGGADLRSLALQPGSVMGGWGMCNFVSAI